MADEYRNKVAPEFNPQSENKTIKENLFAQENKTTLENVSVKENIDTAQEKPEVGKLNKAKKNNALGALSAGLVGTIALVLTTMTSLVNVKMKAEFNDVVYEDGVLKYSINVKDMTEKENLTLYPARDNKSLEKISLIDDDGDGLIEGAIELDKEYIANRLASGENVNIKYVLNLKGMVGLDIERAFDRWVVRIDKQTSKFENVSYHCECGHDGYFYFTMNFEDDNQLFTDFEAWIEDAYYEDAITTAEKEQHIARCTFTENLHDEQRIFVNDLGTSKGKLFIKYKADGKDTYVVEGGTSETKDGISINM